MKYLNFFMYFESKPTGFGWVFFFSFLFGHVFLVFFFFFPSNETEYFFGVMTFSPDLA